MKKLRTQEERDQYVVNWKSSKLSMSDWCTQQRLSRHTFRKWVSAYNKKTVTENASNFIPITVDSKPTPLDASIEIIYPNGVTLRLPNLPAANQITSLVNLGS